MSGRAGRRVKSWHESKHLRKRAAFLLEDPNLIPTDVCFRIRTNNRKIKVVRGHKIFFALASPVFHAELYGSMKEEGNVEITDVSFEAFLCLKRYVYTDSFDGVSLDNMIDVLAASKKYLMAKLTRYCYGFIQNHITAESAVSLWVQAGDAYDDIVVDQCAAEIKRNTSKAVLSDGFLDVSQDQVLEITGWQKLTTKEFDLYEAVKRWKISHESSTNSSILCSLKDGGIFQNIRFALLTPEQIADKFILDEVFSAEEVKEMFCYKNAGKELTTFSPRPREPEALSFQLTIRYFVSNHPPLFSEDGDWRLFGFMDLLIWADVAPKACRLLRRYIDNDYYFAVSRMIGTCRKLTFATIERKQHNASKVAEHVELNDEDFAELEKGTGLWCAPDSVVLTLDRENGVNEPELTISSRGKCLSGKQPEKPRDVPGLVIGKVLHHPSRRVDQLEDFISLAECSFEFANLNTTTTTIMFECLVSDPEQ